MLKEKEINEIKNIISTHETFRNSYFWTPPSHASARRSKEFDNKYDFIFDNQKVSIHQNLKCSCKNMYFKTYIEVDGIKKDIRFLKKNDKIKLNLIVGGKIT